MHRDHDLAFLSIKRIAYFLSRHVDRLRVQPDATPDALCIAGHALFRVAGAKAPDSIARNNFQISENFSARTCVQRS